MTDDIWEQESVDIQARPSGSSVCSFRLPTPEFHQMLKEAQREGVKMTDYIRSALRLRMGGGLPVVKTLNWCISTPYMTVSQNTSWTETQCRANIDLTVSYK